MIDKHKFVEILHYLEENDTFASKFRQLLEDTEKNTDFISGYCFSDGTMEWFIIQLLEEIFHDTEAHWISYWVFELNYGQKYDEMTIIDNNLKQIKIKTAEELYDFLIKEYN